MKLVSYVFKTQHFRYGKSKEEIFLGQFPVLLTYDGKKWTISPLKDGKKVVDFIGLKLLLETFMEYPW
jgi:hypothetical protein